MSRLSTSFRPLLLGVALAALPAALSWTLAPVALDAQAAPGGNGNGNGNGGANGNGGNGNGGAGGNGNDGGGDHAGLGAEHANESSAHFDDDGEGGDAGLLGSADALHASPSAFEHADPDSRVGMLAGYRDAIAAGDLETAAGLLDEASNKPVTLSLRQALNAELGVELDPATEQALADLAVEE